MSVQWCESLGKWEVTTPRCDIWYYPGNMTSNEAYEQAWEDYKEQMYSR